jgi:hypothetical protein
MQEVEEMVEEADVNNDGQVNYTQYYTYSSLVPVLNDIEPYLAFFFLHACI